MMTQTSYRNKYKSESGILAKKFNSKYPYSAWKRSTVKGIKVNTKMKQIKGLLYSLHPMEANKFVTNV
jgi:hypothetical protein